MNLDQTSEQWEKLAKTDPLWAVLSWPGKKGGKWNLENFFLTGVVIFNASVGDFLL